MAKRKEEQLAKRTIGRFLVLDPEICHGKATFRGTRILLADVLEQVAAGVEWETIVEKLRACEMPPKGIPRLRKRKSTP